MSIYYGPQPTTEQKRRGTQLTAYEMASDIERLTGRDTASTISEAIKDRQWEAIPETERQELVLNVWKKMISGSKSRNPGDSESIAAYFGKKPRL